MFLYFKSGRSVWFREAKQYEIDGEILQVIGPRKHVIAEARLEQLEFWCWDNEDVTTYGCREKVDPDPTHD